MQIKDLLLVTLIAWTNFLFKPLAAFYWSYLYKGDNWDSALHLTWPTRLDTLCGTHAFQCTLFVKLRPRPWTPSDRLCICLACPSAISIDLQMTSSLCSSFQLFDSSLELYHGTVEVLGLWLLPWRRYSKSLPSYKSTNSTSRGQTPWSYNSKWACPDSSSRSDWHF